jgi:hypothetical protein
LLHPSEGSAKRRYRDKRPLAAKMWATLTRTLQSVGVEVPQEAVAA